MPDQPRLSCPACSASVPVSVRVCPACGTSLPTPAESTPTEYMPPPSSSAPADEERFLPGTLIAGRYRIAGQLGRGGMGEVYRATDLVLRQSVALKFLPETAGADEPLLERFLNEVRIARQISHPNVCRVYDIGVYQGLHYISMEYVDGEDLASLIRRIGRLPSDKALELARRISAGLAAAHEKGVLHRDLKPANIMIDGRGEVRIMDFGLAGWSGQFRGAEIRSGTPGYMAPEQLAGAEVTARSDIYSLGVVLYEMFTGKRAFEASSIGELSQLQAHATPVGPSTVVRDLDPAIERVILRCLDPDPARRPASALAVAAALPGGDPLAAALAAGETPSPEMVAAAGVGEVSLRPGLVVAILLFVLVGLALCALLSGRQSVISATPFDNPPAALAGRARDILATLGYAERPADTAEGFAYNSEYLNFIERSGRSPSRWSVLADGRPAPVIFWYRTSPRLLRPSDYLSGHPFPGVVSRSDPPPTAHGMIALGLDTEGRLLSLSVVTPQHEESPPRSAPFDWNLLFNAARLDPAKFTRAEPQWFPLASTDARQAWTGSLRVEAAAFHGRPVYFQLIGPWTHGVGANPFYLSRSRRVANVSVILILLLVLFGGCVMARRNTRLGRGDPRGAARLAAAVFSLMLLAWAFGASHVPDISELLLFIMATSWALFFGALAWVLYLALEPFARRHWPQTLISWSRVLHGDYRDPLVARDALFGLAIGTGLAFLLFVRSGIAQFLGGAPTEPDLSPLFGVRDLSASLIARIPISVAVSLMLFFLILGFRSLLRRQWLASAAFVLVFSIIPAVQSDTPLIEGISQVLGLSIILVVLLRFGLLAVLVTQITQNALISFPFTLDFSAWHISYSIFVLLVFAALTALAVHFLLNSFSPRPSST